jgi:hypothetical protein
MIVSKLEKELENAQERLKQAVAALAPKHKGGEMDEHMSARAVVLLLERKLAAERMEEYADTLDFPVKWDIGAPMPHLLSNGIRTLLLFYLRDDNLGDDSVESIALIQFHRCLSVKLGTPNEEVFHGHPLHGKGLEPYTAQIVRNSKWIHELEAINKVHSNYNPELWHSLNHYILWFHDETFECVAKSYEVEVFQKSMSEVIAEATKRILV